MAEFSAVKGHLKVMRTGRYKRLKAKMVKKDRPLTSTETCFICDLKIIPAFRFDLETFLNSVFVKQQLLGCGTGSAVSFKTGVPGIFNMRGRY